MPTPEENAIPPSPALQISSSRASFASCPPDEEREHHAPREARAEAAHIAQDTEQQSQPPPIDRTAGTASLPLDPMLLSAAEYHVQQSNAHSEDNGAVVEEASPVGTPDASSESDARLAQSMATTALEVEERHAPPQYLMSPTMNSDPYSYLGSTSSFLRPGSKFQGTQQSNRQRYEVQVEIKDVNMAESFLCGFLRIQGLTDDHPTLTTFFEGEIIGPKYLFRTTNPSWNSSEKIDLTHWARFPAWRPLATKAKNNPHYSLRNNLDRQHLFMRWKEYFLVPDHRVKSINGASFEGFYYICFDQFVGSVSGIYYHAKSENNQRLELQHVPDGGCVGAVEFR